MVVCDQGSFDGRSDEPVVRDSGELGRIGLPRSSLVGRESGSGMLGRQGAQVQVLSATPSPALSVEYLTGTAEAPYYFYG